MIIRKNTFIAVYDFICIDFLDNHRIKGNAVAAKGKPVAIDRGIERPFLELMGVVGCDMSLICAGAGHATVDGVISVVIVTAFISHGGIFRSFFSREHEVKILQFERQAEIIRRGTFISSHEDFVRTKINGFFITVWNPDILIV